MPHSWQSKGLWKVGLYIWITNSAFHALFLAIKMVMNGIARMIQHQYNIGISHMPDQQSKVSKWIAIHLQQINGLQIQHFVPYPAIKKWQLKRKIYGLINIIQIKPLIF